MFTKSKGQRRVTSLFYALAITLGIYVSVNELHFFQNTYNFFVFSIATFFIYLVELYTSFQNKSRKIQINFNLNDEVNELSELFHKILLPIFLYLSILGFSYFNITNSSIYIILLITFFSFYALILNTKLFFDHEVKQEHKTHYVYDVIKFLIFFLMVDTFANLYKYLGNYIAFFAIGVFTISFLINYLMLIRVKMLQRKFVIQTTLNSFIIGIAFLALNLGSKFNALQISLMLIFLFYISTAIIHHAIRKTLTREVFLEYMIVTMLLLVIAFLGI